MSGASLGFVFARKTCAHRQFCALLSALHFLKPLLCAFLCAAGSSASFPSTFPELGTAGSGICCKVQFCLINGQRLHRLFSHFAITELESTTSLKESSPISFIGLFVVVTKII